MNNRIIIHFPFKINRERAAASQLRPLRIIEGFKSLGYDIYLVEGTGADRRKQICNIKKEVKKGVLFDFMYSECSTLPTLMTEKHHYPTYPYLDFCFFKFCRNNGINIGLFYRDIYWCFPENNHGIIRKMMKWLYRYDLHEYNKYVSTLFVPSFEMVGYIPFKLKMDISELYPGCDKLIKKSSISGTYDTINILYIGGIGHHYDVSLIMSVVKELPKIHLTICCRPDEWEMVKGQYQTLVSDNISIIHKSGNDLAALYKEADMFCLFVRPDKYREFAVPFKLFESIGYGCPIIASEGTWVARFVKSNEIGFTCPYNAESLYTLLEKMMANPLLLLDARKRVEESNVENTWKARCMKIAKKLSN